MSAALAPPPGLPWTGPASAARAGRAVAGTVALIDGYAEFAPPAHLPALDAAREEAARARHVLASGGEVPDAWLAIGRAVIQLETIAGRLQDEARPRR